MWVKLRVGEEKRVFVFLYSPETEEIKNIFWRDLTGCFEGFRQNGRILILGSLNGNAQKGKDER